MMTVNKIRKATIKIKNEKKKIIVSKNDIDYLKYINVEKKN